MRALYEAKARLKRKGVLASPPSRFVRVERAETQSASPGYCRVHLSNGTAVDVACAREDWGELLSSVAAKVSSVCAGNPYITPKKCDALNVRQRGW